MSPKTSSLAAICKSCHFKSTFALLLMKLQHVELRLLGCASVLPVAEKGGPRNLLHRSSSWDVLATAVLHLDQLAVQWLPANSEAAAPSRSLISAAGVFRTNSSSSQHPAAGDVGSSGAGISRSRVLKGTVSGPASPSSLFAAPARLFASCSHGGARTTAQTRRAVEARADDRGSELVSAEALTVVTGLGRGSRGSQPPGGCLRAEQLDSLGNIADYAGSNAHVAHVTHAAMPATASYLQLIASWLPLQFSLQAD